MGNLYIFQAFVALTERETPSGKTGERDNEWKDPLFMHGPCLQINNALGSLSLISIKISISQCPFTALDPSFLHFHPFIHSRTMRSWPPSLQFTVGRVNISSPPLHRLSPRIVVSSPCRLLHKTSQHHHYQRHYLNLKQLPTFPRRWPCSVSLPLFTMATALVGHRPKSFSNRRYSNAASSVEGMPSFAFAFE